MDLWMLCVSVFIKMSLLQGYRHFTDLQWKDSDTKRSSKDMRREKKKSFHRQTLGLERTLKNKSTTTFLLLVIIFSSFMIACVTPCGGPNPHVGNQTYPQFPSDPCLWRYVCVCVCVQRYFALLSTLNWISHCERYSSSWYSRPPEILLISSHSWTLCFDHRWVGCVLHL